MKRPGEDGGRKIIINCKSMLLVQNLHSFFYKSQYNQIVRFKNNTESIMTKSLVGIMRERSGIMTKTKNNLPKNIYSVTIMLKLVCS